MANDVVTALRPVQPLAQGSRAPGSNKPSNGNILPLHSDAAPAPAPPAHVDLKLPDLSAVVANLNQYLRSSQRDLEFSIDKSSGRTIINVVNSETGEIVRQIPPAELLAAARSIQASGLVFRAKA
jgi:flagellar protein FlaG